MIAKITSINFGATLVAGNGKRYSVTELTYQPDGKDAKTANIFKGNPAGDKLRNFKVGDKVTLIFTKNAKGYNELADVEEYVEKGVFDLPQNKPNNDWNAKKDDDIRKAVAIKAAVELVAAGVEECRIGEVLSTATLIEEFLKNGTVPNNSVSVGSNEEDGDIPF